MIKISGVLLQRYTIAILAMMMLLGLSGALWLLDKQKDQLLQASAKRFAADISLAIREFRTLYTRANPNQWGQTRLI